MFPNKFLFFLTTTLFFCFVISSNVWGQKNYLEGQIITLDGAVKKGWIDYQNWNRNPEKISFKKAEGSTPVNYSPKEIRGFKVANENYESAEVQIEISTTEGSSLTEDKTLKLADDIIFLQTILKGEKSLFLLRNNEKELFYIKEGNEYQLLKYKLYIKKVNGTNAIVGHKAYIKQLDEYLKSCSSIIQKLTKVEYNTKDLKKIFLHYYDCTSSKYEFLKKREKAKYQVGLIGGVARNGFTFDSSLSNYKFLTQADFSNNKPGIIFGLQGELLLARNRRKISLYHEVFFSSYDVNGYYEEFYSATDFVKEQTNFKFSYLNLNLLPRFSWYSKNETSLFINAGISLGLLLNQTNSRISERAPFGSSSQILTGSAIGNNPSNREFGFVGGVGAKFHQLSGELRYQGRIGMLPLVSLGAMSHQFALILGYKF